MAHIDGYRLLGIKASSGDLYDLGWVQVDRSSLEEQSKREQALVFLQRFATGRNFKDGDAAVDLRYVWGHTHDNVTGERDDFYVPLTVNQEGRVEIPPAPNDQTVEQFLAEATGLIT